MKTLSLVCLMLYVGGSLSCNILHQFLNSISCATRPGNKEFMNFLIQKLGADARVASDLVCAKDDILNAFDLSIPYVDRRGIDVHQPEIIKAACHGKGSTKRVKELLDAGANIEERYRTFFVNGNQLNSDEVRIRNPTSLICASRAGNKELINLLLQYGADINARDASGWTSLTNAAQFGNPDTVRILLEHGADVNGVAAHYNGTRRTSLMGATLYGKTDTMRILLEHGADVNAQDNQGMTSLLWAQNEGIPDKVKILLEHGADVNSKNWIGQTSLMGAARFCKTDAMRILLEHGADVNTKSVEGFTALDYGLYYSCEIEVEKILRAYGAKRGIEIV